MEKRQAGQIIDDKKKKGHKIWLVLAESKGKEGKGFTHNCGTPIQGKSVAHPIHDGPFPLSGFGQVHYETVPFCAKCETEPDFHGLPIDHDPVEKREMEILRRIAKG